MEALLIDAGYKIADTIDDCDVAIINTCSFIQSATEESIDAILDAINYERNVPVVVSGCMPSRFGDDLIDALPEVSEFVGCSDEGSIVSVIERLIGKPDGKDKGHVEQNSTWEYVKISDGCDRFCSYCTIPFIRGRYKSFSEESILKDIQSAVARGAKEIILIGQDTGIWGHDLVPPSNLATLLKHVSEMFPETWFRVMYIQPEGITDELLEVIAGNDNVCNYLDIPIQHVSTRILKDMNRASSIVDYAALSNMIREKLAPVCLRTTVMVGFPKETEEEFAELVDFLQEGYFDYVGVFAFSPEEGTLAYKMDGQIDDDEKAYRESVVRDIADAVGASFTSSFIGHNIEILVDGAEEDGQLVGHSKYQAPEVDGVTFVDEGNPFQIDLYEIEDTLLFDMEGTAVVRN